MKKKILIVGGSGFIGYHLAKEAVKKNYLVSIISKNKPSKNWMYMIESISEVRCDDQSFRIDFKSNLRFSRTLSKKEW